MLTPEIKMRMKNVFRALEDVPLDYKDPRYVQIWRGEGYDPIQDLQVSLENYASASVHLLLGQRGSGKSTELRRLKGQLEESGYEVFLCDMKEYIHMYQPLEIGDFLVSLMGALSDEVAKRFDATKLKIGYWDRFSQLLQTRIEIETAELRLSGVAIKASLKADPDFKKKIQEKLRGHITMVRDQAWEFASEIVDLVRYERQNPDRQVVMLVDSLEQLSGIGPEAKAVYQSLQNLFSSHANALQIPKLHVVYCIPPYLPVLLPNMGGPLGGAAIYRLPSVHVRQRYNKETDEAGLAIMVEIVAKRYDDWGHFMSEAQLRRLGAASGGDLRDFFRLIKDTLTKIGSIANTPVPILDRLVQIAEERLRSEMLPIPMRDALWLFRIIQTNEAELQDIDHLDVLARFFNSKLIHNYRNGEDWYDVHPLLKEDVRRLAASAEANAGG